MVAVVDETKRTKTVFDSFMNLARMSVENRMRAALYRCPTREFRESIEICRDAWAKNRLGSPESHIVC